MSPHFRRIFLLAALSLGACTTSSAARRTAEDDLDRESSEENVSAEDALAQIDQKIARERELERRKLMTPEELARDDEEKALAQLQRSDLVALSVTGFGREPAQYCPWARTPLSLFAKTKQGLVLRLPWDRINDWGARLETTPAGLAEDAVTLAPVLKDALAMPPAKVSITLSLEGTSVTAKQDLEPGWDCSTQVLFSGEKGEAGAEGSEGTRAKAKGTAGDGGPGGDGDSGRPGGAVTAEAAFVLDAAGRRFLLLAAEAKGEAPQWALTTPGRAVTVLAEGGRGGAGGRGGRGGELGACPPGRAGSGGTGGSGGRGGAGGTVTLFTVSPQVAAWVDGKVGGGDGGASGGVGESGRATVRCADGTVREGREGSMGSAGREGAAGEPGAVSPKVVAAPKLKLIPALLAKGTGFKLDPDQSAPPRPAR